MHVRDDDGLVWTKVGSVTSFPGRIEPPPKHLTAWQTAIDGTEPELTLRKAMDGQYAVRITDECGEHYIGRITKREQDGTTVVYTIEGERDGRD